MILRYVMELEYNSMQQEAQVIFGHQQQVYPILILPTQPLVQQLIQPM